MAFYGAGVTFSQFFSYFLLIAANLISSISADFNDMGGTKNEYNEFMFTHAISKSPHFIMFFAPWCGHCKKLMPVWDELGDRYNSDDSVAVTFAKVDCTAETKVCHNHDVKGYPTLKLFSPGVPPAKYTGARDFASIENFMQGKLNRKTVDPQPPEPKHALYELTQETFKEHIAKGNHFVKFYAPWCGHCKKLAPVWEQLAEGFSHNEAVTIAKIDCTANRPVCVEHGVSGFPTLKFFKDGEVVDTYSKERDHKTLKEYVSNMMRPPPSAAPPTQEVKKEETVQEQVTLSPKESKVVVLSDESFSEGVSKGITFVKFFAPWCGHCKKLAPTFEQLAQKLDDKPGLTAAKIDCTLYKQMCNKFEVKGYPTLLAFRDGKLLEKYTGMRSLDDMYSFMLLKFKEMQKEEL